MSNTASLERQDTKTSQRENFTVKGTEIQFSTETVTPDMARKFLAAANPSNLRQRDEKAVAVYAAAMRTGAWVMNGQPIIFDNEGYLIDGVQRLNASIEADLPFKTFVARNVRADTLHTIDQHRRRAYHGVLEARGIRNASSLVHVMGKLIRFENGILGVTGTQISWARYDRVLDANPELQEAMEISDAYNGNPIYAQPRAILTFMAMRAGHLTKWKHFLAELEDEGATVLNAATILSTQLQTYKDAGTADVDRMAAMTIMAFNDYINDTHRKAYAWDKGNADLTGKPSAKDLTVDMETGHAKVKRYPRARTDRYHDWNLNFPQMIGYPGVREGIMSGSTTSDDYVGKTVDELKELAARSNGKESATMMEITPDLAQIFLEEFNKENRNIQETHIQMIARDIKNEKWMVNAQPICFTADPFAPGAAYPEVRLLNGQHRLEACVRAGLPIEAPIAIGIDRRAFSTYDSHAKKNAVKSGSSGGDRRIMGGAALLQWRIDNELRFNDRARPSSSELIETIERHPGMADQISLARRLKDYGSAGVMTFFIYHLRQDAPHLADEFLEKLETGQDIERGSPLTEMRDRLMVLRPQALPETQDNKKAKKNEMAAAKAKTKNAPRKDVLRTLLDGWEAFKDFKAGSKKKASAQTEIDI
jgi:hypothetical protein